jgi:hypothetical protein
MQPSAEFKWIFRRLLCDPSDGGSKSLELNDRNTFVSIASFKDPRTIVVCNGIAPSADASASQSVAPEASCVPPAVSGEA